MKIISMDVMSTGVIAYYVLIASRDGMFTPILSDVYKGSYADPVPQAVILTAIVIGFSIQALILLELYPAVTSRSYSKNQFRLPFGLLW